ncbi:CWF19-like protein 1 [Thelohanellus kitauei]|uniref:CWF19-like protein 1 n=1 Tax=Thelohanellus kitauei TaxID=669202 RepID=A0A0C2M329_THEKT|nr:CWF19-like protein 1 [Thelohanellus kitauei]
MESLPPNQNNWGISSEQHNKIIEYVLEKKDFKGVDFFISPIWPSGILDCLDEHHVPWQSSEYYGVSRKSSAFVTKMANILKPRYHISSLDCDTPFYYQRPPFRVHSHSSQSHLSYFVSLAPFNNPNEEKSIFTLKVSPITLMNYSHLCQATDNLTNNPFPDYNMEKIEPSSSSDSHRNIHNQQIQINLSGQQQCWFCLENPMLQKHLIFYVAEHNYLALAKGALVPDHFLLCSKAHVTCAAALDPVKLILI